MGEPAEVVVLTDDVILEGGPADGEELATDGRAVCVVFCGRAAGVPIFADDAADGVPYADTGRRTADGRRVFAAEGRP